MHPTFWTKSSASFLCTRHFSTLRRFPSSSAGINPAMSIEGVSRVLVTGAGGRTGGKVVESLLGQGVAMRGLVRSEKSKSKLEKLGLASEDILIADVTDPPTLATAMEGIDAVILCTSAVPKIYPFSIVKLLVKKLFRSKNPGRPKFYWCENGEPETVDWLGSKAQIDAAKAVGVKRFVFVSSMGGTQPDNFLNTIGKKEDGTGGDILLWKRKAEQYLIESGLTYTIVHPGGLLDSEGGKRRLVLGLNDDLLKRKTRSVPRADVARLCVESLRVEAAANKSFDLASDPEGEGEVTFDFEALIGGLAGTTDYTITGQPSDMN